MTSRTVVIVAVVAVFLAGCATPTDANTGADTESSPSASGEPTPSTTAPAAETDPPFAQPFDGDCAAMFTPEQVESVLGVPAAVRSAELSVTANIWARSMGGLSCAWDVPDEAAALVMAVYPAAVFPGTAVASDNTCGVDVESFDRQCDDLSMVENEFWFSGSLLLTEGTSADAAQASVDTLGENVAAASLEAGDAAALVPDTSGAGTWPASTSCAAIGETVDAAVLLGNPALTQLETSESYQSVDPSSAPSNGWWGCTFSGEAAPGGVAPAVFVEFSPGAAWAKDKIAALPGAEELSAEGVDGAILAMDPAASPSASANLSVFDGPNLLTISTRDVIIDESFLPFAVALVAERNAAG